MARRNSFAWRAAEADWQVTERIASSVRGWLNNVGRAADHRSIVGIMMAHHHAAEAYERYIAACRERGITPCRYL